MSLFNRILPAAILVPTAGALAQPTVVAGNRMPTIVAEDSRGVQRTLRFDTTGYTLVGVTDRAHKAALSAWFAIATDTLSSLARYAVVALPSVPRPFRGMVRSGFETTGTIRYLMDWGGTLTESLAHGTLPLVALVAPGGTVSYVATGGADSTSAQSLRIALTRAATALGTH